MSVVFSKGMGTFLDIGVFVWPNLDFWDQGRDRNLGPGPDGKKIQIFFYCFFLRIE